MARAISLELTAILQTDTVITACDVAIGYAHILGMVNINAVAIANLKIVQKVDAVDDSLVASDEMHGPVSPLLYGNVTDSEIPYISKC